jgi:alpha-L-fucosidase 2
MKTSHTFVFLLLATLFIFSCSSDPVKVACIGDSIPAGDGLPSESRFSYPAELANLLGPEFMVLNLGRSGATMLKQGNWPYWSRKEFFNVLSFQPDIVIIQLGTNDTKPFNWNAEYYKADYQAMIDALNTLPGPPQVFVCLPVPVIQDQWGINDSTMQVGVVPIVKQIAENNNLKVIDLNSIMKNHPEDFPDGVHPNSEGAKRIAAIIGKAILEK